LLTRRTSTLRWFARVYLAVVLTGCAGPQGSGPASTSPETRTAPKAVVAVVRGDVPTLVPSAPGPVPGLTELVDTLNPGLTVYGPEGRPIPKLAEAVPTAENGLWKVSADGKMEVTWKLRPNAVWHDGTPVTSKDFIFRSRLDRDERMPFAGSSSIRSLESVEAIDDHTLLAKWKEIYLQADEGFSSSSSGFPLPAHILEPVYAAADTERFLAHPYWTDEFIGTGPFKLKQWMRGSGALLEANSQFYLGRPKIDTIEVKFMADPNTIAANILAGEVDVTWGGRLALDWAEQVRDRAGGRANFGTSSANPMVMYINHLNPNPPVIRQPEFRRALVHALDRQAMVDNLVSGLTDVAHATILNPSRSEEYNAAKDGVVRYPYDPRRASELIESLGMRKGTDGTYQDSAGQKLVLELRTTQGDVQQERSMFSAADYWTQVGLGTEPVLVPSARRGDDQYRATFPGFDIRRNPHRPESLRTYFHGSQAPLPERNYRGNNYGRYMNPEFDAMIDRLDKTISKPERYTQIKQITTFITDQVLTIGLFYDVEVTMRTSRMQNVSTRGDQMNEVWNVQDWDVR
jgi:peptide/nickel transport system substrate-binding protein